MFTQGQNTSHESLGRGILGIISLVYASKYDKNAAVTVQCTIIRVALVVVAF